MYKKLNKKVKWEFSRPKKIGFIFFCAKPFHHLVLFLFIYVQFEECSLINTDSDQYVFINECTHLRSLHGFICVDTHGLFVFFPLEVGLHLIRPTSRVKILSRPLFLSSPKLVEAIIDLTLDFPPYFVEALVGVILTFVSGDSKPLFFSDSKSLLFSELTHPMFLFSSVTRGVNACVGHGDRITQP